MLSWQASSRSLRGQGQGTGHIERFLAQVQSLPGDELSDLFMHWHRVQGEQRNTWAFVMVLCTVLAATLAHVTMGWLAGMCCLLVIGGLGVHDQQLRWQQEMAFSRELDLRARYAVNTPVY